MLFRKSQSEIEKQKETAPEKLKYMRYYEHDGALRAYANRAMVLAFLCVPTALVAVGLAAYVRLQPPTVIRVNAEGQAATVGQKPMSSQSLVNISQGAGSEANDFEKRSFLRLFLEHYLNFSPDSVNRNWAEAVNMMTSNLRRATLNAMEKDNTVGKIQDDQITAVFHLRSIEPSKDDPLSFIAYGVKEVHRVSDHREMSSKLIGKFRIRLITEQRTDMNPSGLLIAEYSEEVIEGEKRDATAQGVSLGGTN